MCKIELSTKEERDRLIESGYIQLGLTTYKIEQIVKSPTRCNNFKQFGHNTISCIEKEK